MTIFMLLTSHFHPNARLFFKQEWLIGAVFYELDVCIILHLTLVELREGPLTYFWLHAILRVKQREFILVVDHQSLL
jgi:hypothetical protein